MVRRCSGQDENLIMYVNAGGKRVTRKDAPVLRSYAVPKPCDCGLLFDDARRSTIYPHEVI